MQNLREELEINDTWVAIFLPTVLFLFAATFPVMLTITLIQDFIEGSTYDRRRNSTD